MQPVSLLEHSYLAESVVAESAVFHTDEMWSLHFSQMPKQIQIW